MLHHVERRKLDGFSPTPTEMHVDSGRCKAISFFLSSLYRLTAFAGLLSIFLLGDVKISALIMGLAFALFAGSYYVEAMMCKISLRETKNPNRKATAEYQRLAQHIESTRQR